MDERSLVQRLELIEYHQMLMMEMLNDSKHEFYKLVIKKKLTEQEVVQFFLNCERMSILMEEQKAEGFVYFHPLFHEFESILPKQIQADTIVNACLKQQLFTPLMSEFKKYL